MWAQKNNLVKQANFMQRGIGNEYVPEDTTVRAAASRLPET